MTPARQDALPRVAEALWRSGYAHLPGFLPAPLRRELARRTLALRRTACPPVSIFRDQAAWRAAALCLPVARYFLGRKCGMLPNLWAMALLPGRQGERKGARGWPPHVDYPGISVMDGPVPVAVALSFWLALSDTGPDNACMHVRPRDGGGRARALPAAAGDLLIWRQDLPHWGGRMTRDARGPRISMAIEFQDSGWPPLAAPLLDPERPPEFADRIRLIVEQRRKYRHLAAPPWT